MGHRARAAVALQLDPILEEFFLPCSYAYRPGRSWPDAVNHLSRLRDTGHPIGLEVDMDRSIDTVDHQRLLARAQPGQPASPHVSCA